MTKSIIALSLAAILSGCGGSDGGSNGGSKPVEPSKPETPQETVNAISDSFDGLLGDKTIKAMCNDVSFDCTVETDSRTSMVETKIKEKNQLITIGSENGNPWNDAFIKFPYPENLDSSLIIEGSAKLEMTLVDGNEQPLKFSKSDLYIGDLSEDGKEKGLYVNIGAMLDISEADNREILAKLADSDSDKISLMVTGEFATSDGVKHKLNYRNDLLAKEAYKAAFTALHSLNESLYQEPVEPENKAPIFNIVHKLDTVAGETNQIQIQASDPDGDPVNFSVAGSDFVTVDSSGLLTVAPDGDDIGDHKVTVYVWDDSEAYTSKEYSFTVSEILNEAPIIEAIQDVVIPVGVTQNVQVVATDANNDELTYTVDSQQVSAVFNALELPFVTISNTGNITINSALEHVGTHTVSVYVADHDIVSLTQFNVTVEQPVIDPEDPELPDPEEDKNTIEYLAKAMNYNGDIEKLKLLFQLGSDLSWTIDDNDQPVLMASNSSSGFHFYPLASEVIAFNLYGYNDEMELFTFPNESFSRVEFSDNYNTYNVAEFTNLHFKLSDSASYLEGAVKLKFTDAMLEGILGRTSNMTMYVTGESIVADPREFTVSTDVYFVGETYREVLKDVLMPYAEEQNPELSKFAELTGLELNEVQALNSVEDLNLKIEGDKPVIYTEDSNGIINRRIDLESGLMELGFVETDVHHSINVGEIGKVIVHVGNHNLLEVDPHASYEFEQTGETSFKAVVTASINELTIPTVYEQTVMFELQYKDSVSEANSYLTSTIYDTYGTYGETEEALIKLLTIYSK